MSPMVFIHVRRSEAFGRLACIGIVCWRFFSNNLFANQAFRRYNERFTTKRAGNYRPFFLVDCFLMFGFETQNLRVLGFLACCFLKDFCQREFAANRRTDRDRLRP